MLNAHVSLSHRMHEHMRMWKAKDLTEEGIPRAVSSDLRLLCLDIETGEKPAENRRASERASKACGILGLPLELALALGRVKTRKGSDGRPTRTVNIHLESEGLICSSRHRNIIKRREFAVNQA